MRQTTDDRPAVSSRVMTSSSAGCDVFRTVDERQSKGSADIT